MKLTSLFDQGTFVVTGEVGPIKGAVSRDKSVDPTCAREAKLLQAVGYANSPTVAKPSSMMTT